MKPARPLNEPDMTLKCEKEMLVDFWIVNIIDDKNVEMLYAYRNGAWKPFECSYAKIKNDKAYYSHNDSNYTRWTVEDTDRDELLESNLLSGFKEYLFTVDKILLDIEE